MPLLCFFGTLTICIPVHGAAGSSPLARCGPVPGSSRYMERDTVAGSAADVRAAILGALGERGYQVASDSAETIVTAPRRGWPESMPNIAHWREHDHPGVMVAITIDTTGPEPVVTLLAWAVCGLPGEPRHQHASVEYAAALAAILDIGRSAAVRLPPRLAAVEEARPALLSCPPLNYPDSLRQAGVGGRLVFSLVIDALGAVDSAEILAHSPPPPPELERAGRAMLSGCRFRPATVRGVPVRVHVELPIQFRP